MKPCPYRKVHEYDAEGLCLHCFAKAPPPPAPPGLEGFDSALAISTALDISPATQSNYVYTQNPFWSASYGGNTITPAAAPPTQQQIDDFVKQLAKDMGQP